MPRRRSSPGPRPLPPLLPRILVQLREALHWTAQSLSAASGVPKISALESGDRPLSRDKLDRLITTMGYPLEAVDLTEVYLECVTPGPFEADAGAGTPLEVSAEEVESLRRSAARLGLASARLALHERLEELRRGRLEEARRRAEEQFRAFQGSPFAEVRLFVENDSAYWTWAFCERLAQASRDAAGRSAPLALQCAELARGVARQAEDVKDPWRERLEGFALGHIANAKKVGNDLRAAERDFGQAWELWKKGGEPRDEVLEVAWLLAIEASLLRGQGRLPQSLQKIDQALGLVRTEKARGTLTITKAITLRHLEDYEGAIATLLQMTCPPADRQLALAKQYALARNFVDLDRFAETEALLPSIRELALDLNNDLELLRVLWLEGLTAAGLDCREQALTVLKQVRLSFADREMAHDAALASLDLAVLYLEEGKLQDVQRLALELRPIFQSRGVHREALAALKLFCLATERGEITVDFIRRVAKYLERARYDPALRFES
jgi:hypothetical protein